MDRFVFIPLLFTVVLAGCSSGKTAYRQGNYAEAVQKASYRLSQKRGLGNRGHELAALVLQQAFVRGYNQHQETIRRLSTNVQQPYRWETVATEYMTLQKMTDEAVRAIPPTADTNWLAPYPTDYDARLAETRNLAAAERYALAEAAFPLRETNRMAAREAYEQYEQALKWVPNYQQATQRSLQAQPFALLRVLVEPPVPTHELDPDDTHELGLCVFADLVRNNTPAPYVHIYQPDQIEVAPDGGYRLFDGFPIHETVQFMVTDYRPYRDQFSESSRTLESDQGYKVGTKRINDSTVVDVMEKVKGVLTLHTHYVSARLDLQLRALDTQTDNVVWTNSDYVTRDWTGTWETFSGDSRALNGHSLLTITGTCPSRRDLLRGLLSGAGSSVVSVLRKQYKKR